MEAFFAVFLSLAILLYSNSSLKCLLISKAEVKLALIRFVSLYSGNMAIQYISYPVLVVSKSAEVLPVIIIGTLGGVLQLKKSQLILAGLMTMGLLIFNMDKIKND